MAVLVVPVLRVLRRLPSISSNSKTFSATRATRSTSPPQYANHEILTSEGISMNALACSQHADEKLESYCNDCKRALCCFCLIMDHNGHDACSLSKVVHDISARILR
ncbi:hypothetical protein LSH36_404g03014 [Paralvinella palmiformis]|uniref:B box-type domain-containing protein n=1 Tax=Paralvinella palmiformis TaxID=53620 RepID=A0AAD9JCR7_9ANNE|nr:hypothetical protein LSH36_404g03014 [Paralvinella palmiformis]